MWINFEELKRILKATKYPVFRDKAPKNTDYPYIIYSFVNENDKKTSNQIFKSLPYYQISLFTAGTEKDLSPIKKSFNDYKIPFKGFQSIQGDENDDTITNFYTYVRCVSNGK